MVRQHSRQLVELTNILDKVFPEFKPFFDGKFSVTALYILAHLSFIIKPMSRKSRVWCTPGLVVI